MKHALRFGAAIAVACVVGANAAHADVVNIGQAFSDVLKPYIDAAVSAAILALISWVALVVKKKFNVDIDAQNRDALIKFAQRQAASLVADGAVKLNGVKVEVRNQDLARAANNALASIPDALKHFDIPPDKVGQKVGDMIVDMLPKEPAVAAAQAVAMDVANPQTPSVPPSPQPSGLGAAGGGAR